MSGIASFLGRVLLCTIFFLSAVAHKVPKFDDVVGAMTRAGIPQPRIALYAAIGMLVLGSVLVIIGYRARFGAFLLLAFLVAASYYFHSFWKEPAESQRFNEQMIQFQKNLGLAGAMLFIIANGPGRGSIESICRGGFD